MLIQVVIQRCRARLGGTDYEKVGHWFVCHPSVLAQFTNAIRLWARRDLVLVRGGAAFPAAVGKAALSSSESVTDLESLSKVLFNSRL